MWQERQMQYIQQKTQHWEQQKAVTKPQKETEIVRIELATLVIL